MASPLLRARNRSYRRLAFALMLGLAWVSVFVVSAADGHPRSDDFRFRPNTPLAVSSLLARAVEETDRTAEILLGVTRWLLFAGLLLMIGTFGFLVAVWRRPKGSFGGRPARIEGAVTRRMNTLLRAAWGTAVVATLLLLPLEASVAAGVGLGNLSSNIVSETLGTRSGIASLIRLGLLAGLLLTWPWVRRGLGLHRTPPSPPPVPVPVRGAAAARQPVWPLVVGLPVAAALMLTLGLSGHAGTRTPVALNLGANVVHLLAVAIWLGGLVGLVGLVFPATRGMIERDRTGLLAPVVSRFSDLALVAVAAIVASGALRAYLEIRSIEGLTGTGYGITLMVKLAAFLPLLGLGAINNRWTKPRIQRAAAAGAASAQVATLRRLVTLEVVLGALILGATAALVALTPPVAANL